MAREKNNSAALYELNLHTPNPGYSVATIEFHMFRYEQTLLCNNAMSHLNFEHLI